MRLSFRSSAQLACLLLVAALFQPESLHASDWPTITDMPTTADEGIPFYIEGQGLDVTDQVVVIRSQDDDGGATSRLEQITSSLLEVTLDPVGRDFIGDLELHVVERYDLANTVLINGPRQYHLKDVLWIKSICYVHGGEIHVSPLVATGQDSELMVPDLQLMHRPMSAMDGTIVLASDPPPSCSSLDFALEPPPAGSGGFFATFVLSQFEGPTPTQYEWEEDLALAIQQSFGAYGVFAGSHPDGLVIGSSSGLASGFALLFEAPEP